MSKPKIRILVLLFIFNIVILSLFAGQASQIEYIYSKPSDITAKLIDNKLVVKSTPEIWNPSSSPFKSHNSTLLNLGLIFIMNIDKNTKNITYNEELLSTLVGYSEIPSGFSKQNLFTNTYTFSYNFSDNFQQGELFNATIEIYTVAPKDVSLHSRINGTIVTIENKNVSISNISPDSWGEVKITTTDSFIFESIVIIPIFAGIFRYVFKKK